MFQSDGHVEDMDLTRSWMLPVFRDHIQDTEIAFFAEYFLPLASQLKLKCKIFVIVVNLWIMYYVSALCHVSHIGCNAVIILP